MPRVAPSAPRRASPRARRAPVDRRTPPSPVALAPPSPDAPSSSPPPSPTTSSPPPRLHRRASHPPWSRPPRSSPLCSSPRTRCSPRIHPGAPPLEGGFLALLDEVTGTGGLFAHVTFLPPSPGAPIDEGLRVNQVATLVRVEEVQREEVGAKVTVIESTAARRSPRLRSLRPRRFPHRAHYGRGRHPRLHPERGGDGGGGGAHRVHRHRRERRGRACRQTHRRNGEDPESLWDISGAVDDVEWGHAEVGNLRRAMAWVEDRPSPSTTSTDPSRRMRLTGSRRCWRSGWRIRSCNWLSG